MLPDQALLLKKRARVNPCEHLKIVFITKCRPGRDWDGPGPKSRTMYPGPGVHAGGARVEWPYTLWLVDKSAEGPHDGIIGGEWK